MKRRITTAREQFDMLSPWMITAAPPAFDKVYSDEGKFLRHQRPEDFPSLQPPEEISELAEPPTQAPRLRNPVQLKMFPNSDFKRTRPEPQGLPEGWSEEKANGKKVIVSPNGNEYGPQPKTTPSTQGIIPKETLSYDDQGLSSNLARFLIPADMERSIIEKYNAADEATKAAGSQWYDTANEYIHNLAQKTGRDPRQVAAIVSAFSPQTSWDANMAAANYFLMNYDPQNPNAIDDKMGGLGDNLERAKRIHAAGDEEGYLAGLQNGNDAHKITNFYHNMMGDRDRVTIDSWMARALMGKGQDVADKDVQKILNWRGGYDTMAGAVQSAAKKLGISPRELQAIVWSHVVPTAGGYEELTPDQYRKQKRQRENYVNNAPEDAKLLPDYFHGPGWQARPEPTYPMRDLVDPQKLYAARKFWSDNLKYFNRPFLQFPEEKYFLQTREKIPGKKLKESPYKDKSRTYVDRGGKEHSYFSPHEINPIEKNPFTGEDWEFPFAWDEEAKFWKRTEDNGVRGRPSKWIPNYDPQRAPYFDPNQNLVDRYQIPDLPLDYSDSEWVTNLAPAHPTPDRHFTPIYRGTFVNVDDFLSGMPSRPTDLNTNDVSSRGRPEPSAEQLSLDVPSKREVKNRSRDSIWDHPDLGNMILDHISMPRDPVRGGGMGRHWTTDFGIATRLVPPVSEQNRDQTNVVPVVLESYWGGRGENPEMPNMGYRLDEDGNKVPWQEDEVNLLPGAQIFPQKVWTIPPGETEWRNVLSSPHQQREARRFWSADWNAVEDHIRGQQYPGVTLRNELGDAPTSGYMVSLPGHEEVRPYDAQAAQATDKDDVWTSKTPMSAETLENFHNKKLPVIMQDKNNYQGGWYDDGDWFDDVSHNYQDIWDAAGAAYGKTPEEAQHGFYDINTGISPSPLEFTYMGTPGLYMAQRFWSR